MTSIDHDYELEADTTSYGETLSTPSIRVEIYEKAVGPNTVDRLFYVDTRGNDRRPFEATKLTIPRAFNTAVIVFVWKAASNNPQITVSPSSPLVDLFPDQTSGTTTAVFPVPTEEDAIFEWLLEGGSPGFALTVKVKRKV